MKLISLLRLASVIFSLLSIAHTVEASSASYTVGGTVSGLGTGKALILKNNTSTISVSSTSSTFTFPSQVSGTSWNVSVALQPSGQTCTVTNPSGSNISADISNISVSCVYTYTVGGTVSGLSGVPLVLRMGTVTLVASSGTSAFKFATGLTSGKPYSVLVAIQPPGYQCITSNGTGTIGTSNVTNVSVTCAHTYTVSGTIFGLTSAGLTLKLNAVSKVVTLGSTSFSFATALKSGSNYAITVATQPTGQICTVNNGSGTIDVANVTNVAVTCSTGSSSSSTSSMASSAMSLSSSSVANSSASSVTVSSSSSSSASASSSVASSATSSASSSLSSSLSSAATSTSSMSSSASSSAVSSSSSSSVSYTISGTVTGLASGKTIVLANGSDSKSINNNSSFTFATPVIANGTYSVTVATQPTGQTCLVTNGFGTITANVINVGISCTTNTYTISGANTAGARVSIANSGISAQASTTASPYTFSAKYGSIVTLSATKSGNTCSVSGSPITVTEDVTAADVTCSLNTYTVSGTISGNSDTVTLTNNGSDATPISANGSFTFTAQPDGSTYSIATSSPIGQLCLITNASGTIKAANVTNVIITCTNLTYTVGGSITGLGDNVINLTLSGAHSDTITLTSDSTYTFDSTLISGNTYSVGIGAQPTGRFCSIVNANGSIIASNIANIIITCSTDSKYLNANIILGAPTNSSIAIKVFSAEQSGNVSVSYGTSPGIYTATTTVATLTAGIPLTVNLSDLASDTQYFYTLNYSSNVDTTTQSPEYQFHTARALGSAFVFTVQADSHLDDKSDLAVYTKTLQNIADAKPDFHVDVGDTFMTEKWYAPFVQSGATYLEDPATTEAQVTNRYKFELNNFSRAAKTVPLFLVNGNHDAELGWLNSDLPTWAATARSTYFNNPMPNSFYSGESATVLSNAKGSAYYAWKWGDALFIALDPFWNSKTSTGYDIWAMTLGATQYQWLQTTLASNAGLKYKFVFLHNLVGGLVDVDPTTGLPIAGAKGGSMRGGTEAAPFGEWGGKNPDGTNGFATKRPGWAKPIHELLKDYGVTAVFHGHDHLYADQVLDGIKYQEVPQPSLTYAADSTYLTLAKEGGYVSCLDLTATCQGSSGYLKVTVSPTSGVTSEYVRTYTLPSQGENKSISAKWNVAAPDSTTYTISGTINGLTGQLMLLNNGVDSLTASANGNFSFQTPLPKGIAYSVSIGTQPTGQTCTVSNGTGTIANSNVVNISVNCITNPYTVGGTVSGLQGSLVLLNNDGDTKIISKSGSFTFANTVGNGSSYNVTVFTQPTGQTCVVTNGTGTILAANITNVSINCSFKNFTINGTNEARASITISGSSVSNQATTTSNPYSLRARYKDVVTLTATKLGYTCAVANSPITMDAADVTNANVTCIIDTHTVSGSISGNSGAVTVTNNGGNTTTVPSGGGNFTFTAQAYGSNYNVSATSPDGQSCFVTNGSGVISTSDINNVVVVCSNDVASYTSSVNQSPLGLAVVFTDTSQVSPTAWLWDFGDGVTSDQPTTAHVFTAAGNYNVRLTITTTTGIETKVKTFVVTPAASGGPLFNMSLTLSDEAQRTTLAFDGVAMLPGNLEAQSFFPPGKVADYTGFQYLRDNDPDNMGHNTSFLTRISNNVIYVLNDTQIAKLKALATTQITDVNAYAYKRFTLMKAFRDLVDRNLSPLTLNLTNVKNTSRELYLIDGQIAYDRAYLYSEIFNSLDDNQKAYLDNLKGKGWSSWPDISESQIWSKISGLSQGTKTLLMTYAGDVFSWYAGSIDADIYFCPERHGTYYGGFYMKDAPAVGHEGYSIDQELTATSGTALIDPTKGYVNTDQAKLMSSLVDLQRSNLYTGSANIVQLRADISLLLRQLRVSLANSEAIKTKVLTMSGKYGELDGENNYYYASVFAQLNDSFSISQKLQLSALRHSILSGAYADGTAFDFTTATVKYVYADPVTDSSILAPYLSAAQTLLQ